MPTPLEKMALVGWAGKPVLAFALQEVYCLTAYTVDEVAAATQANMVVNYPKPRVLNPNQTLNRGAAAALIHQAMTSQGKLQSLPRNVEASNYIVNPTTGGQQTAEARQ